MGQCGAATCGTRQTREGVPVATGFVHGSSAGTPWCMGTRGIRRCLPIPANLHFVGSHFVFRARTDGALVRLPFLRVPVVLDDVLLDASLRAIRLSSPSPGKTPKLANVCVCV